jgi:uncharacterized membrane protein YsdA (DUF1294 family)
MTKKVSKTTTWMKYLARINICRIDCTMACLLLMIAPVAVYFCGINAASAGLFYYDKFQAQSKGWRVPEKQLQLSALLGGWVGGMWAMQTFRHKTVKQSFKIPYLVFYC